MKLTETAKTARINEFLDYIKEEYENDELRRFIIANQDTFFENKTSASGWNIPRGSKLVKSFKHFVNGKQALDDIQTRASRIIQEDVVTGTLCFSVHPLDYLSSSENTYNWRSCHALDGEYRAGNLSYMCDKATIICYLKGADNVKLPMFPEDVPWNNKKWRVLFYVSDNWDLIFAGRQYPFNSDKGLMEARLHLLHFLHKDPWYYCEWTDPIIDEVPDSYGHTYDLNSDYVMIRGELYKTQDIVIDPEKPLHFNDVLHSSYYKPHYTALNNRPWFKDPISRVHVGSSCNCLRCNSALIRMGETMMCDECDLQYGEFDTEIYTTCDCCGRRIYIDDAWYVDSDEICEDCMNNECFVCEDCEELHYNSDKVYIETEDKYVCTECSANY